MASKKRKSRTRNAVLGVLAYGPSTGYEIRKLLSDTTSHFWKESYGQIYPTLEELRAEGLIEVAEHETTGRETRRFAILPEGEAELRDWIRSPRSSSSRDGTSSCSSSSLPAQPTHRT